MNKIEIFTVRDTHIEKLYDVPEWKLVAFQNNLAPYFLNDDNLKLLINYNFVSCRKIYPFPTIHLLV